ncbi:MAG: LysM peptidoglycan-binding domain-containing protein [Thermoanaerobaculia bacterium]|nr:MAG: LysM peptidoglycan-binding domain-containing protein [Thermoanaerobaculia bacterium]
MAIRSRLTASLAVAFVATALVAADQPPKHLKLVGDHWTAWDPPTTFPEGAKVHIVERGDTLWDLAGKNLGNPYLWPQIWEKNQYVLDAHWIYPGDPLVIGIEVTAAEDAGATTADAEGEGDEGLGTAPAGGKKNVPVPLGSESDIYCSGYVGELEETTGWSIVGSEYDALVPEQGNFGSNTQTGMFGAAVTIKYKLVSGDIVYLDGGRSAGLAPGMVLEAVESGRVVRHPVDREVFGRLYATNGRVRVLSVQDTSAIAEILQSCDGMRVGARLRVFEPEPVPLARRTPLRPVNEPTQADLSGAPVILTSPDDLVSLGQDHVVFLDRGAQDDLQPGDLFTIYRPNQRGGPPVVIGELAVLSAKPRSAVAKILESRYPVYVGDRLERK